MAQMDALALEAAEEVFGHGVVIGIALAGHALPDAEAGETLTVSVGGVLTPRSEWKMRPGRGLRRRTAMPRAARVRFVSMRSEKA